MTNKFPPDSIEAFKSSLCRHVEAKIPRKIQKQIFRGRTCCRNCASQNVTQKKMLAFCRYTSIAEHAQRGDVPRTIRLRFKASWVQHPWNTSVLRTLLDKSTTFCNKRQWPAYEPDAHQEPAAHACSCYIQNNLYHKLGLVKMVLAKLTGALINKADRPWVVRQPCPSPPPPAGGSKSCKFDMCAVLFLFISNAAKSIRKNHPKKFHLRITMHCCRLSVGKNLDADNKRGHFADRQNLCLMPQNLIQKHGFLQCASTWFMEVTARSFTRWLIRNLVSDVKVISLDLQA